MKSKLKAILMWFSIWMLAITAFMGANLSHAKAVDPLPTVKFDIANSQSQGSVESVALPIIQVSLSDVVSSLATVEYTVTNNSTAILGDDYRFNALDNVLTFNPGDQFIRIPLEIMNDKIANQSNKTIELELSNPMNNVVLGTPVVFTYTILEDAQVTTTLSTNPALPDGENDWFVTNPEITLNAVATYQPVAIYYQWDSGALNDYIKPFSALEGEHILYFYAEDQLGNKEAIQQQMFKVDTVAPVMNGLSIVLTADNQIQLSWDTANAEYYEIYLNGKLIGITTDLTYLDKNVQEGNTYAYKVVAIDMAGNKSKSQSVKISVPVKTVVIEKITTTTTTVVAKPVEIHYITPTIAEGTNTVKAAEPPKEEVKAAETVKQEEPATEDENGVNWNKLILAISILIIAAGIAVGGYYGYEWFMARREEPEKEKAEKSKSKSRW